MAPFQYTGTIPRKEPVYAYGWICPRCNKCHAPFIQACDCSAALLSDDTTLRSDASFFAGVEKCVCAKCGNVWIGAFTNAQSLCGQCDEAL
jgi:hypothetical protein